MGGACAACHHQVQPADGQSHRCLHHLLHGSVHDSGHSPGLLHPLPPAHPHPSRSARCGQEGNRTDLGTWWGRPLGVRDHRHLAGHHRFWLDARRDDDHCVVGRNRMDRQPAPRSARRVGTRFRHGQRQSRVLLVEAGGCADLLRAAHHPWPHDCHLTVRLIGCRMDRRSDPSRIDQGP